MEGKELGQHILREHADVAWQQYAQIYLEKMWFGQCEQDKRLVDSFKNNKVTCEMLSDLFGRYNLPRNFVGGRPERYERFAEMLNSYRDEEFTKENFPGIVEKELGKMS